MTRSVAGLFLSLPSPALYGRLLRPTSSSPVPAPTDVAVAHCEGSAAAASLPGQPAVAPAVLVVENRPSDPQPVVTPQRAKAGGVRRAVQGTPCHDCHCCDVYSGRLTDAHDEIDRLRVEIVAADGRRLNHRHVDPTPFGNPT